MKGGFKMALLNIFNLYGNIDELRHSISNQFIDLIAFSETRLDHNITDNLINLDNYDVIRKDRTRNGGGVCLYLRLLKSYLSNQNPKIVR